MSNAQKTINTCATLLGENINEKECEILTSLFALRKLAVDEILLREGTRDDELYIVIEGEIIATRDAGSDESVILHHLQAGDIAGALGFIDGENHSATLRATTDSHVLTLYRDDLEGMISDHPQLVYKIMKMIVRSVHQTLLRMNQQFVEMDSHLSKERVEYSA